MSAKELLCAAPSQQRLLVASLLEVLLAAPREGTRQHLEEEGELLLQRSISSVAAA